MNDKPTTAELITMLSEFNCHADVQKLASDRLEAAEATIKAAGKLAERKERIFGGKYHKGYAHGWNAFYDALQRLLSKQEPEQQ